MPSDFKIPGHLNLLDRILSKLPFGVIFRAGSAREHRFKDGYITNFGAVMPEEKRGYFPEKRKFFGCNDLRSVLAERPGADMKEWRGWMNN
jgi:hypothetical protein